MRLIIRYAITAFTLFFLLITLEVIYYNSEVYFFIIGYYKSNDISRNKSDLVHDKKETHPEFVSNPKKPFIGRNIAKSWKEYQNNSNSTTGNPLIDDYGKNDPSKIGEYGRGVTFVGEEKIKAQKWIQQYQVNVYASDLIPLNRMVPDSRFINCKKIKYPVELPTASVIIPFYDEWPSLLLRTVYSVVNRTPRHLLEEIILVDDGSTLEELKGGLEDYIKNNFPEGLIKLVRLPQRSGLIKARTEGWKVSSGKVLVFFDSHMEVNINWTHHIGKTAEDVRPGTVMVGSAYAIDSSYFREIGAYDEGMKVWGGENLEMSWRDLDVGNISERLEIKKRLQCKPFSYFLANSWPELLVYNQNVYAWGSARNPQTNKCLDNHNYFWRAAEKLYAEKCTFQLKAQGFSWMTNKQLRTTLQCVVVKTASDGERPMLEDCFEGPFETWEHNKGGYIKHEKTGLCLDIDISGPIMRNCTQDSLTQLWEFNNYLI